MRLGAPAAMSIVMAARPKNLASGLYCQRRYCSLALAIRGIPLKSWRFDYWAAFYIRFETYLTYDSGDLMQFHGSGGGTAIGAGIYGGGAPGTNFSLSPAELIGECSFYFSPVVVGGLVHFWRGNTSIGTLVGAGIGQVAAFGGTGTWSRQ